MQIETKYNIGDKVFGFQFQYARTIGKKEPIGPMTIGRVSVEITDSPGIEGEEMFNNYMPQKGKREFYMCVETGVGSGTIHYVETLFDTWEEADAFCKKENKS